MSGQYSRRTVPLPGDIEAMPLSDRFLTFELLVQSMACAVLHGRLGGGISTPPNPVSPEWLAELRKRAQTDGRMVDGLDAAMAAVEDFLDEFPGPAREVLTGALRIAGSGTLTAEAWTRLTNAWSSSQRGDGFLPSPGVARLMFELAGIKAGGRLLSVGDVSAIWALLAHGQGAHAILEDVGNPAITKLLLWMANAAEVVEIRRRDQGLGRETGNRPNMLCSGAVGLLSVARRYERDRYEGREAARSAGDLLSELLEQVEGAAVLAVPEVMLFGSGDAAIRRRLLAHRQVRAVIRMPMGSLGSVHASLSLLVLDALGGNPSVRFVDASRLGGAGRDFRRSGLSEEAIADLVAIVRGKEFVTGAEVLDISADTLTEEHWSNLQVAHHLGSDPRVRDELALFMAGRKTLEFRDMVDVVRTRLLPEGSEPEGNHRVFEIGTDWLPEYGAVDLSAEPDSKQLRLAVSRESLLREGDFLLVIKGSASRVRVGLVCDVPVFSRAQGAVPGQSMVILRLRRAYQDLAPWLLLLLRSPIGQALLQKVTASSTIPVIQVSQLRDLGIPLPKGDEKERARRILEEEVLLQQQILGLRDQQAELSKDFIPVPSGSSAVSEAGGTRQEEKSLAWVRVLIRSGFDAKALPDGRISLERETLRNLRYLADILKKGDFGALAEGIFTPKKPLACQDDWLKAVAESHGSAEGGPPDELAIMDTYMAGVIRWMNQLGIMTSGSCDASHRGRTHDPYIWFADKSHAERGRTLLADSGVYMTPDPRKAKKLVPAGTSSSELEAFRAGLLHAAEKLHDDGRW